MSFSAQPTSVLPTLQRERLVEEFLLADPRLVKLIAPAGYGKTTLGLALAKAVGATARCDCLQITTPIDLMRGILGALATPLPDLQRISVTDAFISLGDDPSKWTRHTTSALENMPLDVTLLFDNGEVLANAPNLSRALEDLLAGCAPDAKVIFCSRVDGSINLTRFAGPERTMRIGPELLRFDRVEIALLLSRVGANASAVARVEKFTQGWPMLVMMLYVLAKRGRLDVYLDGKGADVTDLYGYLASEVLATIEPWAQDILDGIASLPQARESDIMALYPNETEKRIAEIQASTPFLLRASDGTLEVHPAIAEILRKRSHRGIEVAKGIVTALSESQPIRAARIAAHLGDFDRSASLLESGRYFLHTPSIDLVNTVYLLPSESLIRYPAVWNVASYSRAFSRDSTEWLFDADRVLSHMSADTPLDVRVELFSGFMNVYTQRGEFDKARGFANVFAKTPAGKDPMGRMIARFWELIIEALRGGVVDRAAYEREVGPLLRVKMIEVLLDFDIFARHERLAGDAIAERAILSRAIDEARATGDIVLRYLTLTEGLFGAWFWGDNDRFDVYVQDLKAATHPAIERALTLLLAACGARATNVATGTEQLKVRTYAFLIGASKERHLQRKIDLLHRALLAADQCGQPFLGVIVRLAIGLTDPANRVSSFAEARSIARETWSGVFHAAVDAVTVLDLSGHMLEVFSQRFYVNDIQAIQPMRFVSVALFSGFASLDNQALELTAREFELLAFLALNDGPVTAEFTSGSLWPDSSAERARSSLKVTLSRLRGRLGDKALISSTSAGYILNAGREVDINTIVDKENDRLGTQQALPTKLQLDSLRSRIALWGWRDKLDTVIDNIEDRIS